MVHWGFHKAWHAQGFNELLLRWLWARVSPDEFPEGTAGGVAGSPPPTPRRHANAPQLTHVYLCGWVCWSWCRCRCPISTHRALLGTPGGGPGVRLLPAALLLQALAGWRPGDAGGILHLQAVPS